VSQLPVHTNQWGAYRRDGIDNRMPRRVFDDPNNGVWSKNVIPASTGRAKCRPNIFLAMSGVPLATVKRAINCRIGRGCIAPAYLDIAQLSCPATLFEQFRSHFRDASSACEVDLSAEFSPSNVFRKPSVLHYAAISTIRCTTFLRSTNIAKRICRLTASDAAGRN